MLSCRYRHHLISSHPSHMISYHLFFHLAATAFSSFLAWSVVTGWELSFFLSSSVDSSSHSSSSLPRVWYAHTIHHSLLFSDSTLSPRPLLHLPLQPLEGIPARAAGPSFSSFFGVFSFVCITSVNSIVATRLFQALPLLA
ncbi:hypothetical protein P168DRAFT_70012 [Aspergillus campestris IBT 28561]|uniref:Uncharacterized protein n=1 Tax=Aspergillus campestris (strain IBT 28561) TaxID=1392248 RepID=A0A2I1CSK7_ASPC2|nr:uncharacterized protein P168DRAFT_70012 [Aspergillus campestris IBT 28561]PKY00597.1 hypothetical protein P168DRAFT_70012 [Aspergillus campestris IBT 28561]